MRIPGRAVLVLAVSAAALAGQAIAAAEPTMRPARGQAAEGTKVKTRSSAYGTVLINARRRTLYLFDREDTRRSECYGACARAWPPLITKARPVAAGLARRGLLGTVRRRNGAKQVTYAGHPLYLYAHEGPGQIFCQNVDEFGGLWLVVRPNGRAVR